MTITFELSHQLIHRTDQNCLASGSQNYVYARFDLLTDDWVAPITAVFGDYAVILDNENQCLVPWEVLASPGTFSVSAFCADLHTATCTKVKVYSGGYIEGQTPQPPTPSVYQELTTLAQTALETANSVQQRADAGEFNGPPGEPGPQGPKGQDGTVAFSDLSEQQKQSLQGKSAYEYAQDGGFSGTEEEFATRLAQEYPAFSDLKAAAPINLFDNSDFINPVNQREVTNQSIPSQYFIDRWVFDRSNQDATYQVGGADGISFADGSWIFQRIPLTQAQMDNKVFTIAVWLADGTVWIQPVTFTAADSYSSAPWASQGIGTYFNNNNWRVTLANLPACTIQYVGLYEGEFTENTLPPYRPKGYAAELEICRRYYFRFAMLGLVGFVQSVNQAAFNISWLKMRLSNPTVNVLIPDNITAYGGIVVPVSSTGSACTNTVLVLNLIGGESLQSFVPVTPFNTVVEITADL